MVRHLLCNAAWLLSIAALCEATATSASSGSCQAGDSKCDAAGLILLQKAQTTKKVMPAADVPLAQEKVMPAAAVSLAEKKVMPVAEVSVTQKQVMPAAEVSLAQKVNPSGSTDMKYPLLPGLANVVLGKYPGYTGPLKITGGVNISIHKGVVALSWHMSGTGENCSLSGVIQGVKNACGLHIHTGKTCSNASEVGGHFYHSQIFGPPNDPWSAMTYVGYDGSSLGSSSVLIGRGMDEIVGRAFVVHDATGGRVACGLVQLEMNDTKGAASMSAGPMAAVLLAVFVMLRM